ncbi:MAG: hypothetical protein COA85_13340 [Robiginitomaculum sp.]|nr:MAG: hypothetical protein COA85_13340 [Robiginitomaculum sp.]
MPEVESLVGYVASVELLCGALAAYGYSVVVGKINIKFIAIVGTTMLLGGNLYSAYIDSINTLFFARAVSGFAAGILLANLNTIIMRTGNADRLFAFSQTSVAVFGIILFGIAPRLMGTYGTSVVFLFIAVVAFLSLISVISLKVASYKDTSAETYHAEIMPSSTGWSLNMVLALLGLGLIFVGSQAAWTYMERMGAAKGYDIKAVGNFLVIGQFLSLLAPIAAVRVSIKFGRLTAITIGVAIYIVILICTSMPVSPVLYPFASLSFQFGTLFVVTSFFGYLAKMDASGKAISSAPAAINIGCALGPGLAGWLIINGGYTQMGYGLILFFVAGLLLTVIAIRRRYSNGSVPS